jgi:hypothetical protein
MILLAAAPTAATYGTGDKDLQAAVVINTAGAGREYLHSERVYFSDMIHDEHVARAARRPNRRPKV